MRLQNREEQIMHRYGRMIPPFQSRSAYKDGLTVRHLRKLSYFAALAALSALLGCSAKARAYASPETAAQLDSRPIPNPAVTR